MFQLVGLNATKLRQSNLLHQREKGIHWWAEVCLSPLL